MLIWALLFSKVFLFPTLPHIFLAFAQCYSPDAYLVHCFCLFSFFRSVFSLRVSSPELTFVEFSSGPHFRVLVLHALDFCYFLVFKFFALVSPRFASILVFYKLLCLCVPSAFCGTFCFCYNVISSRTVFSFLHILFVYNDFMSLSSFRLRVFFLFVCVISQVDSFSFQW